MRRQNLISAVWTGEVFIPDGNQAVADVHDRLGEGEVVVLDLNPERSERSHRHQFAFVDVAWENLPENLKDAPFAVTPDTLRKHALVCTGHCNTQMVAVGSPERAERVAAVFSQVAQENHGYAVTEVKGNLAYCHTPHSQKLKEMGREAFENSKQDILEYLADLIGVEPASLASASNRRAA